MLLLHIGACRLMQIKEIAENEGQSLEIRGISAVLTDASCLC